MKTKHFKIYTGYAETKTIYEVLQQMADGWNARRIKQVRVFRANFTDVYLSITASWWYHWSDCNDPDWPGDAMDYITDHKSFRYNYKRLVSRPRPESRWIGNWREFNAAEELRSYTQKHLNNLMKRQEPII